jgi:hypothetical protein
VAAVFVVAAIGAVSMPAIGSAASAAPAEWDERVEPFVRFVEKARGLEFEHPVKVRFLRGKAFEEALVEGEEPTAEDRALDEHLAGELVALGLASERVDFDDGYDDASVSFTAGFYDQETEGLVVRGTDLDDVEVKVTIVHELVHALQDQHFDLDALDEDTESDSEYYALSFLVEGDATAVETEYLDSLPAKEQDEYWATGPNLEDDLEEGDLAPDVAYPYVLDLLDDAPYVLGEAYVTALDPGGGTKDRNRAFELPPKTEEVLIDPVALDRRERTRPVADPTLAPDEVAQYEPEQLGVISLYLILAPRLGARTALEAVTGWGGDRSVGFQRGGQACVRANLTGDRPIDTDELDAALVAWQAAMPPGAVEVSRAGDVVTFTACEAPGVVAPTVEQLDSVFYNVLAGRVYEVLNALDAGLPLRLARCAGDWVSTDPEVIAAYDASVLEGRDLTKSESRAIDRAIDESIEECLPA